jgi:hypothetical protein
MKATERRTTSAAAGVPSVPGGAGRGPARAAPRRLAWTLPAGLGMLILAACGDTVVPTTPTRASPAPATPTPATAFAPSVTVRGLVVDSSGKPLANVLVQWLNIGEGEGDLNSPRGVYTDASGSYRLVVSGLIGPGAVGGYSEGWFEAGASREGYRDDWKSLKIPDRACTSDNEKCDLVANFTLTAQ